MVQRLTYRKRHSYATKSNQHRILKTPGGKLVYQTAKKRARGPTCPVTGKRIQGIPHLRPTEYKRSRLSRNRRTVARAYGGVLSGCAVRESWLRSMAEVKLLGAFPSPYCYRVEWALKLKGVEYDYSEENLQNKSPLLLQSNPVYKKIPVLIHAGKPITESQLIIQYIDEAWKENPLLPEDPYERAIDRFWAKFGDEKCLPAMYKFLLSAGKEQEKAIQEVIEGLKTVEEHGLKEKKKRFFAGERVGIADLVFGFIAWWFVVFEEVVGIKVMDPKIFPCLHAWMHNFLDAPVIKENLPSRDGMLAYYQSRRESFLASVST